MARTVESIVHHAPGPRAAPLDSNSTRPHAVGGDFRIEYMTTTEGTHREGTRLPSSELAGHEERLRTLVANLLLAEEHERRRLAADLHDGLSQTLALIAMKVASLRRVNPNEFAKILVEITALVDQANSAARTIGYELSPPVLHDVGLESAVQWLGENVQSRYGVEVSFTDDMQPKPTDEPTRIVLVRGIRELLLNVARHASAKHVKVSLQRSDDCLVAVVHDDGIGMDAAASVLRGSGLFGVRERIEHVGGSFEIDSSQGHGTRVRLTAPCLNQPLPAPGAPS